MVNNLRLWWWPWWEGQASSPSIPMAAKQQPACNYPCSWRSMIVWLIVFMKISKKVEEVYQDAPFGQHRGDHQHFSEILGLFTDLRPSSSADFSELKFSSTFPVCPAFCWNVFRVLRRTVFLQENNKFSNKLMRFCTEPFFSKASQRLYFSKKNWYLIVNRELQYGSRKAVTLTLQLLRHWQLI